VLSIVSLGQEIAVLPDTLMQCVSLPGVVCRPIAGKAVQSELAVIFRRHERAPAVQLFLKQARDYAASLHLPALTAHAAIRAE